MAALPAPAAEAAAPPSAVDPADPCAVDDLDLDSFLEDAETGLGEDGDIPSY